MNNGVPTFDEIVLATSKRRDAFIDLAFGQAKCRIKANGDWTEIDFDFDFLKMGADLSKESSANLAERHKEYLARNPIKGTKVKGDVKSVFGDASLRMHVRNSDAKQWYHELLDVFADEHNFRKIRPFDFLEQIVTAR